MTITTDNYEYYFYQYAEGQLTEAERIEVEAFLQQHPDLADELSLYDSGLKLEPAPVAFPDKESLFFIAAQTCPHAYMAVGSRCLRGRSFAGGCVAVHRKNSAATCCRRDVAHGEPHKGRDGVVSPTLSRRNQYIKISRPQVCPSDKHQGKGSCGVCSGCSPARNSVGRASFGRNQAH